MNCSQDASDRMCLIIHSNPVVAQDLSEILCGVGISGDTFDTFGAVDRDRAGHAKLVVAESGLDVLMTSDHASGWLDIGVPVILLGAPGDRAVAPPDGVYYLEQPFRTEDVLAMLHRLAVI